MGNQIVFPENNPLPRDLFSCGQSKQAVSLYHTNYNSRFDKTSLVLTYGQIPLIKSRYLKYINNEEHPYGRECYCSNWLYMVVTTLKILFLFNEGSINTRHYLEHTYYNMYEARREDSSKVGNSTIDRF